MLDLYNLIHHKSTAHILLQGSVSGQCPGFLRAAACCNDDRSGEQAWDKA